MEDVTFCNTLGRAGQHGRGLARSSLGDQKAFGVQQWFSLHYRNQHCGLCLPSLPLSAERRVRSRLGLCRQGHPRTAPWLPACLTSSRVISRFKNCEESPMGCTGWECSQSGGVSARRSGLHMPWGSVAGFSSVSNTAVFVLFFLPRNKGGAGRADV